MTHAMTDHTDDKNTPDTKEQKPMETKKDDHAGQNHDQKTDEKKGVA